MQRVSEGDAAGHSVAGDTTSDLQVCSFAEHSSNAMRVLCGTCSPCVPPAVQAVESGPVCSGPEMVQVMSVVAIEACPIQLWTVARSTPLASHRQAAVWRRS